MSAVEHPEHYNQGQYECIKVMRAIFGDKFTICFMLGSAFKYLWRFMKKAGAQDIRKSKEYLNMLTEDDYKIIEEMCKKEKGNTMQ